DLVALVDLGDRSAPVLEVDDLVAGLQAALGLDRPAPAVLTAAGRSGDAGAALHIGWNCGHVAGAPGVVADQIAAEQLQPALAEGVADDRERVVLLVGAGRFTKP